MKFKKIVFLIAVPLCLAMNAPRAVDDNGGDGDQDKKNGPNLNLAPFVDALPIPPSIMAENKNITIHLSQFAHQFHRDLNPAQVWGYEGSSPGPTVEVERGQDLKIHWTNRLPKIHVLPAGRKTAPMPEMDMGDNLPEVRAVTHLHGAEVSEPTPLDRQKNNDGWPDAWTVAGEAQLADYPNHQAARTLWYHDHAMGMTAKNVYSGLEGFYIIHDAYERSLNLPSGAYEIPLMLQSRSFNADGSMFYPDGTPSEFYGNTNVVNGKVYPYLDVEPRKYRFRILNAANARSYAIKLVDQADGSAGPVLNQIGSDGGFLEADVILNDRLTLAPAERADVIIDFSKYAGKNLVMNNNSQTDDPDAEPAIPNVMLFRVKAAVTTADASSLPAQMAAIPKISAKDAVQTRKIVLSETDYPDGSQMVLMNNSRWTDPVTEKPVLGTTEIWELVNTTDDIHPFHIHLVDFQVLDRIPFDADQFKKTGNLVYTGPAVLPDANEAGWKDTIKSTSHFVTRIIMKFAPYPGYYVYHCHILEHEDMDMMRPFEVVPNN